MSDKEAPDTKEAFESFMAEHPQLEAQQFMADAVEVQVVTLGRWRTGEFWPKGTNLVRLRCALHLAGYQVAEFDDLAPLAKSTALLMLKGDFTLDSLVEDLEYEDHNGVYRIVLQGRAVVSERSYKLEKLVRDRQTELDAFTLDWQQRYRRATGMVVAEAEAASVTLPPPTALRAGASGGVLDLKEPLGLSPGGRSARPELGPSHTAGDEKSGAEAVSESSSANDAVNAMLIADITPAAIQTLQSLLDATAALPVSGLVRKQVLKQLKGPDAVIGLIESLQDLID